MPTSSRYPGRQGDLIPWMRARANTWKGGQAGVPNIGLTQLQADEFDAAVTLVEDRLGTQVAAIEAAESATRLKDEAFDEALLLLGSYMGIIDKFGRATKDPGVWARAGFAEPKKGGERPAPPAPTVRETVTQSDGAVLFEWEVAAGGGAQYEVQRSITGLDGAEGAWVIVDFTGEKKYLDQAVPVGVRRATYRVRARLSNGQASPWSSVAQANFGTQGSQGGPLAAKTPSTAPTPETDAA
ncbi:MAG: hypothetical protein RIB58_11220 [Phycisphaerales bacterium]